jgi:hypothetical protein
MSTLDLAQRGTRKPGWRRNRAWAKFLAGLLAPVVLAAGAFQLQPTYIRLDIPVSKNPVGYFWYETQRAQLAYADTRGVLYLNRQAGTGYAEPQGWYTIEDAFATFDRWFKSNGWSLASAPGKDDPVLPESRFLEPGNLRVYYRAGNASERAALAVWKPGGPVHAVRVVLVTSRPSWLMQISRGLD